VQIEVDSEHAKVMFQIQICIGRSIRNYIKFDGKQTQNLVLLTASLAHTLKSAKVMFTRSPDYPIRLSGEGGVPAVYGGVSVVVTYVIYVQKYRLI